MNYLRVAVISDLHASTNAPKDTYIQTEPPASQQKEQPLADLIDLVNSDHRLQVDVVICAGDLANRSDDVAKIYGWRRLNELTSAFGARHLFATPGNHDLTTRDPVTDPAETLKNLTPSYPNRDAVQDSKFWADGYSIFEATDFRIVNLNSCFAFPPHPGLYASADEIKEYETKLNRGAFDENVERALAQDLKGRSERATNILVCHHHPVEHQLKHHFQDTYGAMERGGDLIALLEASAHCGRWTVIHGHKHVPMLTVAGGSANSPIVLCAASLGHKLWHPVVSVTRNQFHILEYSLDVVHGLARTRGTVQSFSWGFGAGWFPANDVSGLPGYCGFGMLVDARDLSARISAHVDGSGVEFVRINELEMMFPELRFQTPRDSELLDAFLEQSSKIVHRDRNGRIVEIAKEVAP